MNGKSKQLKSILLALTVLFSILTFSLVTVQTAQAHIVIIGSPSSDLPSDYLTDAKAIAAKLKAKGYTGNKLVELYGKQATSKNILKAMYNADAVIYIGHGGYYGANYNGRGGYAKPPFSLVGYARSNDKSGNEYIWGIGDKMRQGWNGALFKAPLKNNSAAFLYHACFSTGHVGNYLVANPVETVYNFARMFGSGVNYYASAYYGGGIINSFLKGAKNFEDANNKVFDGEKIKYNKYYQGTNVRYSSGHDAAFIGNGNYKFPSVSQVTAYNPIAAEAWYNGDRNKLLVSAFTAAQSYIGQTVKFTEYSCDVVGTIVKYTWDLGDGSEMLEFDSPKNFYHNYTSFGNYKVMHKVTNNKNQTSTAYKTVSIQNRAPVVRFTVSSSNPAVKSRTTFTSKSFDPDYNDTVKSFAWNFGDGTFGNGAVVNHTFYREGFYKVKLSAKDSYGKTGTNYRTVKVGNPKPDLYIVSTKKSGTNRYVKIKNRGTADSKGFHVRIWNGKYSSKRYRQVYVKSLKKGSYKTVKITKFKYRKGKAKVDYYNKISEKKESNNIRRF